MVERAAAGEAPSSPQPPEAGPVGPGFTASRRLQRIGTERQCRRAGAVAACQCGDGIRSAGVRAIAKELNRRNFTTRNGRPFSSRLVHQILYRTAYIGRHVFNATEAHTKRSKPPDQHIVISVPAIIDEATFDAVHAVLRERDPMRGATPLARRTK